LRIVRGFSSNMHVQPAFPSAHPMDSSTTSAQYSHFVSLDEMSRFSGWSEGDARDQFRNGEEMEAEGEEEEDGEDEEEERTEEELENDAMIDRAAEHLAFEAQLEQIMAHFWEEMREVTGAAETDTNFTRRDLPMARVRRIMRQDACDNPRMMASDSVEVMGFACELFVRALTVRAWGFSERSGRCARACRPVTSFSPHDLPWLRAT